MVFWRCLHRRGLILAPLLCLVPRYFKEDLWLIEEAGMSQRGRDLEAPIESFHAECKNRNGFLHDQLRIRISGRRLMSLFTRTMTTTDGPA